MRGSQLLLVSLLALALLGGSAACKGGSPTENGHNNDATVPPDDGATTGDGSLLPDGSSVIDNDGDGYPADQDCDDNDPSIYPGVRRPCLSECDVGTETCLADATWSTCTASTDCECTNPGDVRIVDCGNCGQATQECGLDLKWGMPGTCLNQGECAPGDTETGPCTYCGTATRLCSNQCTFGPWDESLCSGECSPGDHRITQTDCEVWERNIEDCSSSCAWETTHPCTGDCLIPGRTGTPDFKDEVCIPAGIFHMGCDEDVCPDSLGIYASPKRLVALSPYFIDKYEVTVARYRECVQAGECTVPWGSTSNTSRTYSASDSDSLPVNYVSYTQALAFCQWDGGRTLPTDAQWEKAARGPTPREPEHPWGDVPPTCDHLATPDCGYVLLPAEVDSHPAGVSFYGIHGLGGNLAEVVLEPWYLYSSTGDLEVDPVGTNPNTTSRLNRGWNYNVRLSDSDHSALKRGGELSNGSFRIGFRCARPGI